MSPKNRRRFAAVIAIILACLLLLPMLIGVLTGNAAAASSKELDALKKNQTSLADEKKRLENERKAVIQQKASVIQQKTTLDKQIEVTGKEIDNALLILEELGRLIAEKELELEAAIRREEEQYALFKTRIRVMEEEGDVSYVGIVLSSDSLTDVLDRFEIISEIMEYDNKIMDDLEKMRLEVADRKAALEADRAEQQEVLNILEDREALLSAQSAEAQKLIDDLADAQAELEAAEKAADEEMESVQREIAKMMAELAKKSVYVGGTYSWPLPSQYTNITSPFGMRMHPTLHVMKGHTGTDVGAPQGTNIFAANSGTVITAEYNSAYGNYVVIDHGGGHATLYAHMSKMLVSKGKSVKKGDVIGLVGSTGYSTGPHLHFEVIENGVQKNPMDYFTKQ